MNEFDIKAAGWDLNPMHIERSEAVAKQILERIPLNLSMSALEYGAGTGITSFLLKDNLREITMLDNSAEMVRIMNEKIISSGVRNLKTLFFDLENSSWTGQKFDLVMTQMVLHHVVDIKNIIKKFYTALNKGGYLAIADLFTEDGSFHGSGFEGHKGFDPDKLALKVRSVGFENISHKKCFVIKKQISETVNRHFDVFLLIANRN
ncbi:MAG: hypothetical protein A2V64_11035 [Bacteroidetes bacterium RBG_13_43_22]|nr:MAG: hypothetical protein A2V64_11035 [Bacteroidetes bacterium RBG_13_43_22]